MSGKGKVAVAIVHGIGEQDIGFEERIRAKLHDICKEECGKDVQQDVVIEGVAWGPVLNKRQRQLRDALKLHEMRGLEGKLRSFLVSFAADAVAYRDEMEWVYKGVHTIFAMTLNKLAKATADDAPLCVIAHSLGSVIASNFIYDLQSDEPYGSNPNIPPAARFQMGDVPTPLERGHTLNLFYTLGSPLALWTLLHRKDNFGKPIAVPPPIHAYTAGVPTGWYNLYDQDDVIGFPLEPLYNIVSADGQSVKHVVTDIQANVGGFISSRTPASHTHYWDDEDVARPIAQQLVKTLKAIGAV